MDFGKIEKALLDMADLIEEQREEVYEIVCDKLCKWPDLCDDQVELFEEHCNKCELRGRL